MGVNDGEHEPLGLGADTVFDGDVPDDRVVRVGFMAFDEDSHEDWSQDGGLIKEVGHSVASINVLLGLDAPRPAARLLRPARRSRPTSPPSGGHHSECTSPVLLAARRASRSRGGLLGHHPRWTSRRWLIRVTVTVVLSSSMEYTTR
jgi:hypothetical protein